jgi:hypothetical protein
LYLKPICSNKLLNGITAARVIPCTASRGTARSISKLHPQPWQPHRYGLMLGLAYSTPDCWLEVSLHPEVPATGQLDQGFPSSQSKCWVGTKIPRCTACFSCSPPNINFSKFRHNIALPMSDCISPHYSRSNIFKIQNWTNPKYNPRLSQKDQRALPGNLQNCQILFRLPPPPTFLLSLSLRVQWFYLVGGHCLGTFKTAKFCFDYPPLTLLLTLFQDSVVLSSRPNAKVGFATKCLLLAICILDQG